MDKYGLIGYPLEHSFSSGFFNEKFKAEDIDAEYINFEIPDIKELPAVLKENTTLKGFNVTIPYKEKIISYLDDIDKDAVAIGAINVVKVVHQKGNKYKLIGYNSDIIGFVQSMESWVESHHKRALILGTGGASKAVFHGLKKLGIESTYVSRTKKNGMLTYEELTPEVMKAHTIIVNCTPLGMYPKVNECPEIPYHLLTPDHLLYDLLYNPNTTLFMRKGEEHGATVKNGLEMLLLQAFASWDIWTE